MRDHASCVLKSRATLCLLVSPQLSVIDLDLSLVLEAIKGEAHTTELARWSNPKAPIFKTETCDFKNETSGFKNEMRTSGTRVLERVYKVPNTGKERNPKFFG